MPAATARQLTYKLPRFLVLSAAVNLLAVITGFPLNIYLGVCDCTPNDRDLLGCVIWFNLGHEEKLTRGL